MAWNHAERTVSPWAQGTVGTSAHLTPAGFFLSVSPHPQSISAMKLMQFQGLKHKASSPISLPPVQRLDLTPSPEVPLMIMKRKLMYTNDLQESRRLVEAIHRHLEVSPGTGATPALRARSGPPECGPGLLRAGS